MDLARLDSITNPFDKRLFERGVRYKNASKQTTRREAKDPEKAVMAPTATMAPSQGDVPYTPKWWRGDSQNYVVAKTMMYTVPKAEGSESR